MKREMTFSVCVDDDNVEILDWISAQFSNGNWDKNFEVTVTMREIDYTEDGEQVYVENRPKGVIYKNGKKI